MVSCKWTNIDQYIKVTGIRGGKSGMYVNLVVFLHRPVGLTITCFFVSNFVSILIILGIKHDYESYIISTKRYTLAQISDFYFSKCIFTFSYGCLTCFVIYRVKLAILRTGTSY